MNHLLHLGLLEQTKRIGINAFHLKNRWLPLIQKLLIDDGIIKVKVERVPEAILKPEILLILSIKVSSPHGPDVPYLVMVVNW